jgi:hypothetical protein
MKSLSGIWTEFLFYCISLRAVFSVYLGCPFLLLFPDAEFVGFCIYIKAANETEICMAVGEVCCQDIHFVWVVKYISQYCRRGSIVPVRLFLRENVISRFPVQYTLHSAHFSQLVITGFQGSIVSGALVLWRFVLSGDFSKILFPLLTNVLTFV